MTLVLLFAAVVIVALSGLAWWWRPEMIVRRLLRRSCVLTLHDGQSFAGLLWAADRRVVVLRNARLMAAGNEVPVDGELVVERSEIAFMQLP